MRRGRARRLGGRLSLVVAAAASSLVMTGCGAGVFEVGSRSVSDCYRAIPPAVTDSGDPRSRLVGVHRLPEDLATRLAARSYHPTRDLDTPVCAVALRGAFNAGQVRGAAPGEAGSYAVILVTSRGLRVVGAFVFSHRPGHFLGRTF